MNSRGLPRAIAVVIVVLTGTVSTSPNYYSALAQKETGCRTFKETGKFVCGRFLQYWQEHGGLLQQGFPITGELAEKSDLDGKTYTVQYFERAVFEMHPENRPPNDVLLSLLGSFRYKERYPQGARGQSANNGPDSQLFGVTGHRVGGRFLAYWREHGGLAQQGYPISEEFEEKSDLNGRTYRVQYFERAVFEWHSENQPPYDMLLSQLGTLRFRQEYANGEGPHSIKTVFVIVLENKDWSQIKGNSSAPYINDALLPMASHAEQFYTPPGLHPSEPNYLWLEAGTNFGITDDQDPAANHQSETKHLVTLLNNKGTSWKAYEEGISGEVCPLRRTGLYAPKHNPMVFFDDVTGNNSETSTYCIAHVRPYEELGKDLQSNKVARYNFITPDQCDDMHSSGGCESTDTIKNGDTWLAKQVPKILDSQVYKSGGALFLTWDEGAGDSDGPIGMIVVSPYARGGGYANAIHYTHSSTLLTMQEIFDVAPLLGDASRANDLSDLFRVFP